MQNYQAALQVLRYLYWTRFEGLLLRKDKNLAVKIYADASYGGEGARSQTGVLITLGEQLVGWYSRRNKVHSITEAEYIADCEGAKDAAWIMQFLQELGVISNKPILYTDSEGAYNLSKASMLVGVDTSSTGSTTSASKFEPKSWK